MKDHCIVNPHSVNLSGAEGNAYTLLCYAMKWSKQLNKDWKPITSDMTSRDYNHLVSVVKKEFGAYVIFEQ